MRPELRPTEQERRVVLEHLDAWESMGLVTHEQALAIRDVELRLELGDHREPRPAVPVETAEEVARPAMADLGHRATR
ncbi:MAG: hypothetical protein ACXWZU_05975 [Actinomycetota bacterium]